jgi:hypothetical protein
MSVDEAIVIVFKCDYAATYPLWIDGRGVRPESLGLSPRLQHDLGRHQAFYNKHYFYDQGWMPPESLADFMAGREALRARWATELGARYTVKDSYGTPGHDSV